MHELTVLDLQKLMHSGELAVYRLVETNLARIEAIDRSGPRLNAILELNPDVLSIAGALDAERREHGPLGPLHGIPILLKGNIDTADRMQTTAGSLALAAQQLDAIVAPTTGPAWPIDLVNVDHSIGSCTTPAAVADFPHITVPAGFVFGLPVGLSFFAGAWNEPTLLRLAYAFEQGTQARRSPTFLPTVHLALAER